MEALGGLPALPALDVAQRRRARLRRLAARPQRRACPQDAPRVGFYGLDLYSLHASIEAVLGYLDKVDPEARACAPAPATPASITSATTRRPTATPRRSASAESCEDEVVAQLVELQRRAAELARRDGRVAEDEHFYAEQNARLAKNAEAYYRAMFRGRIPSWNLRDRHMAETLDALVAHLDRAIGRAKVVVWAHNSHLGDARATEMGAEGELNVGQLVRERHGRDAVLVGFTHLHGHRDRRLRLGRAGASASGCARRCRAATRRCSTRSGRAAAFLLPLRDGGEAAEALRAGPAGAGHRRDLPARDRAPEPLLPGAAARSVRRRPPLG